MKKVFLKTSLLIFTILIAQETNCKILQKNSSELSLFNALLEVKPVVTARAKYMVKLIEKIESLTEGKTIDTATFTIYKTELIKPLISKKSEDDTTWLDEILEKSFIMRPIITESLGSRKDKSYLMKFLDCKKKEANDYFQKTINNVEDLISVSSDLKTFMVDIIDNMSDGAKKSFENLERKLIERKTKNSNK